MDKLGIGDDQDLVFFADSETNCARVGNKEIPIALVRKRYPKATFFYFDYPTDEWSKQRVTTLEEDKT